MTLPTTSDSLSRAQIVALTTRSDLLEAECAQVRRRRISWRGRLAEMGDYGRGGGSAADRRLIIEAMAALEAS